MSVRRAAPPRAWLGLALAALVLLALPARADYKDSYRQGLDAIQRRKWDEAIRDLRAAIAEHYDAAGLMGAGLFKRYTPHYFLGVALAEQGDCRAAVEAFDVAEQQGKMAHDDTIDLQRRRQSCKQKLAVVSDAAAQAQREVDGAAGVGAQLAALQASPGMRELWRTGSPSLESRQQAAASRLAGARTALEHAQLSANREQADEAGRSAAQARKELEALLADANSRRAAAQAEIQREVQEIKKSTDSARKDLAFATRTFSPLPPALKQRCDKVEAALTAVAAADPATPMVELRHRQETLRQALRELRAAIKPPPDDLQKAAAAYLSGDYQGTLAALAALPAGDARVAAHACLLRAAALHGIHLLQSEGDARTLEAAKDEVRRCQSLAAPVQPLESAFPPSFRALWQEVAAAAAPPSAPPGS